MNKKILKTIKSIDDLDIEEFKSLNIGVEIQDFREPNLSKKEKEEIIYRYKNKFKYFNNIKSIHGPFLDLKPTSSDELIRDISFNRYLETIKIGKELNVDYIIFHSQINPHIMHLSHRSLNNNENKKFWRKILNEVSDFEGIILLENIFEESPEILKELVETINLPNIKINLDIGHAKLGKVSLEEWIRELQDYIEYIHIHSNDGIFDTHQIPTKDEVEELYYLLDKYNINPTLSLEYETNNLSDEIKKYI